MAQRWELPSRRLCRSQFLNPRRTFHRQRAGCRPECSVPGHKGYLRQPMRRSDHCECRHLVRSSDWFLCSCRPLLVRHL
jgi:hypothetical protein